GVVPSLCPGAGVCWRGVRSRVVVVPLPPGWCDWHPGFPSGMFHLFPSLLVRPLLRWLSPPLLACCRWSSLSSSEGGCVGCQHLFPRCCRHAMFFFLVRFGCGSVRFGIHL
ncbi:hypothetical protein GQ42DRAFT_159913, partial [Ramicandelaber brevisporus]